MDFFNRIVTTTFDALLYPFGRLQPIWGLAFVSVLTGAALVWLFGRVSNQRRVRTLKATMKGHLLEVWIFRDRLPVVLKAEGRLLRQTGKYLLCTLPSFLVLMVPVLLIMVQLQARYGYRPLHAGEQALLKVFAGDDAMDQLAETKLKVPKGLVLETPALRIPRTQEVDFRIKAVNGGRYEVGIEGGGKSVTKTVDVGPIRTALSPQRSARFFDRLLYPVEAALPAGPIASAEIAYPQETIPLGRYHIHWVWLFLVISMAAGYALKGVFRVEL
jgi:hypothetical protein